MQINQEFFDFIEPGLKAIKEKVGDDFIIFGSAILYLLNILEFDKVIFFHDLDIIVKDEKDIPKEATQTFFQNDPNKKLYRMFLGGFEVDFGGMWPESKDFFYKCFEDPFVFNGYKFISLDKLQEWKEKENRPKDRKHVAKIKEFKNTAKLRHL